MGNQLLDGDAGRRFDQGEAGIGDVEDAEVGDDAVDAPFAGEWEGAVLEDLRRRRRRRAAR